MCNVVIVCGFCYGGWNMIDEFGVKWYWDDIVWIVLGLGIVIGGSYFVGNVFLC